MKKEFLTLLFLFLFSNLFSQEYYFFKGKKEILTKAQLDDKISKLNEKSKKINSKKTHIFVVNYKVINTIKKSDSILNEIRYDFKYVATKNEKIYAFENKKLPDFNLRTVKNKWLKISDLKGKVTFINLWFTNCYPCVKEIPLLNVLQKKYKKEVNFLAITFDSKEKVKKFLQRKKFKFEHVVGAKNYLSNALGNISYPKIIILDKEGTVRYLGGGIPSEYDYEKKEMRERTEKDMVYLEKIINKLNK